MAPPFPRILVPLDGTRDSEEALRDAWRLAAHGQSRVHLLHVARKLDEGSRREALRYLDDIKRRPGGDGIDVITDVSGGADVARTITDYIPVHHIDATLIATHGRTGWERLIKGSIAESLLRSIDRPFLMRRLAS